MRNPSIVAAWSALLIPIAQTASASINPSTSTTTNSYWSRAVSERQNSYDNQDEADLESLQEALSGWERRPSARSSSGGARGLSSSSSSLNNQRTRKFNEEDVDFKQSQDWWKDPLAQFDDNDSSRGRASASSSSIDGDSIDMNEPVAEDFSFNLLPIRKSPASVQRDQFDFDDRVAPEEPAYSSEPQRSRYDQADRQSEHKSSVLEAPKQTRTQPDQDKQVALRTEPRQILLELPVLVASIIPAPVRQVLSRIPAMQVLALLAIGRQIYQWRSQMQSLEQPLKKEPKKNKTPAVSKKSANASTLKNRPKAEPSKVDELNLDSETEDEEDLDEIPEAFRNNPRTRAVFENKKKKRAEAAAMKAPIVPEPKPEVKAKMAAVKPPKKRVTVTSKSNTKMMPVMSGGWTDGIFGPRRPSARQLMEKVTVLEQSYQQAQQAKSSLEKAYENANWQLQESQTEFDKLKQTTKYLQAQLRDNEEMLERVVEQEQRKAKDELMQMKEAMIKVVERKREAMREEFIKQAGELEQVWKQSIGKRRPSRSRSSTDTKSDEHNSI